MSNAEVEQFGKWIAAASEFAGYVGSNPPQPLSFYDPKTLPAPREWIEKGILALVRISRDDRSKGHPILWAEMLDILRLYQPGVGETPVGVGSLAQQNPFAAIVGIPGGVPGPDQAAELTKYVEKWRAAERQAAPFKAMAANERARDSKFLADTLGLEWQEHLRKAEEFVRRASMAMEEPGGRDAILRQLDADRKSMGDFADRMEAAARGRASAEPRIVATAVPEQEATRWDLTMGTTPARTPPPTGIVGCESTPLMIAEARRMTPKPPPAPAPPVATPTLKQEPRPAPPPTTPERLRPSSWAAPLSVLGCVLAAGVCASGGDSKGVNAALCYIFVGIPLVLFYFRRRRTVH